MTFFIFFIGLVTKNSWFLPWFFYYKNVLIFLSIVIYLVYLWVLRGHNRNVFIFVGKKMAKQGVLVVNLGTPPALSKKSVRQYLREFLSDPRVIDCQQ